MQIRPAWAGDAAAVAAVYNHYIEHTVVTFEEHAVSVEEMAGRIARVATAYPYLVAEDESGVVAYAYADRWHERCSYRGTVETTIYVAAGRTRARIGTTLYSRLLDELAHDGYHTAIGGIALPNAASVALHEKLGFERAGCLSEVGFKLGRWVDVGYWQRMLGGGD